MKADPYKKSANKYDTFVEPFNKALRQIGLKLHPPTEGLKVLDVGCGTGTTDDTFDLAVGMLILHEMRENVRTKVLMEMMRVIKKEGRILIIDFHPGSIHFPKGWIYKAVIFFFEITAGYEHFKNFRNFISRNGIPGLVELQSLTLEKVKIVGGGNLGLFVISVPASINRQK